MFFPFLVILPGMIAMALHMKTGSFFPLKPDGALNYDRTVPLMMKTFLPQGLLGLGMTALIASFMSGMAGNVTAFNTVWTYDIYRASFRKSAPDAHYVSVGRWCTILGVLVSIGTAYLVMQFASIMDYVQALFSFFIAPLFGTVLLGMLWKRASPAGGFWGLAAGTAASIGMWGWVKADHTALQYVALSSQAKDMAENMFRALWSGLICATVTIGVSLVTKPKPDRELVGLVMGCTEIPGEGHLPLYQRPVFWAKPKGHWPTNSTPWRQI
jgi:SSS family solute:Na+ symporter